MYDSNSFFIKTSYTLKPPPLPASGNGGVIGPAVPPTILVRLRVRIIFLRPPPPLLVLLRVRKLLNFEDRFAIFFLYTTHLKKLKPPLNISQLFIKILYNPFLNLSLIS